MNRSVWVNKPSMDRSEGTCPRGTCVDGHSSGPLAERYTQGI